MRRRTVVRLTGARNLTNTWAAVDACKLFMPCNGLIDGNMRCEKTGAVIAPQYSYEFQHDAARNTIQSTATGIAETEPLFSGVFEPIDPAKYTLLFYAGYMMTNGTMRVALGDNNTDFSGGGFGMSDGASAGLQGHVVIGDAMGASLKSSASHEPGTAEALGTTIYNLMGTTGHFFRYALARPDTQNVDSGAYRTDSGAAIRVNTTHSDTLLPFAQRVGVANIPALFRMHNVAATVIARFDFSSMPTNLMAALNEMAAASRDGNPIAWPYWD